MTTYRHLTQLETSGLIRLAQAVPELEYLFRHALVQEAAYRSLLRQDRKRMHRAVGETLERLYPERLDELAPLLGQHFAQAGEAEKAINYVRLAGESARRAYANEEAVEYFRQALALLEKTAPRGSREGWQLEFAAQLYEDLGEVLGFTGRHDEAREAYQNGLDQGLEQCPTWRARLHRKIGNVLRLQRQYEEALTTYMVAETALGQEVTGAAIDWWQEWVQIQLERMELYYFRSQWREMAQWVEKCQSLVERYGTPGQRILFLGRLSMMYFVRDGYAISEEALAYKQAMLIASQETGNPSQIAVAQFGLGFGHLWRGELDEAEEHMRAALRLVEQTGDVVHQSRCLTYLTILYRKRGQVERTRQYITRSLAAATAGQMLEYVGMAKANLAWVAWYEGNLAGTYENGRAALEIWQWKLSGNPFCWTAVFPLIGVTLAQDRVTEAIDYARILLGPTQQRLPDDLTAEVKEALQAWTERSPEVARTHLERALGLAQRMGYL